MSSMLLFIDALTPLTSKMVYLAFKESNKPISALKVFAPHLDEKHIGLTLKHCAFLAGHYQATPTLTIESVSQDLTDCQYDAALLIPGDINIEDGDTDIVISDILQEALESLTDFDDTLTEQLLNRSTGSQSFPEQLGSADPLSPQFSSLYDLLLNIEDSEVSTLWDKWRSNYRFLMDSHFGLYVNHHAIRPLLTSLIKGQLKTPSLGKEILLSILHRSYLGKPEHRSRLPQWFQDELDSLQKHQFIEILEPITDFKVSVVIFSYNRVEWLKHAVDHVLNQTYDNWQLVIADHGSTDGTQRYAQDLAESHDKVMYWRYDTNKHYSGIYDILERFYTTIDSELIITCTDDDWLEPQHMEKTVAFMQEHPWVAGVGGILKIFKSDKKTQIVQHGPMYSQPTVMDNKKELQRTSMICPLGCEILGRKSLYQRLAPYDPMFVKDPQNRRILIWDYMNNVKLFSLFEVGYIPEHLYSMRGGELTTSFGRDNTEDFLIMLEEIIQGYNQLYGDKSFPTQAANFWLYGRMRDCMSHLQKLLENDSLENIENSLDQKKVHWKKFVSTREFVKENTSAAAPVLFDTGNPYL